WKCKWPIADLFPGKSCVRREAESLRPPSPEVVCCLAWILGESRDSGRVPGLGRIMDDGISSGGSRTFGGKSRDPLSFSRSGLIVVESYRVVHLKPQAVQNVCSSDK